MNLYDYLKSQFNDLLTAQEFYRRWRDEWKQRIPGQPLLSLRAMAGHCSVVLEQIEGNSEAVYSGVYLDTKYGSAIYWTPYPEELK